MYYCNNKHGAFGSCGCRTRLDLFGEAVPVVPAAAGKRCSKAGGRIIMGAPPYITFEQYNIPLFTSETVY